MFPGQQDFDSILFPKIFKWFFKFMETSFTFIRI